MKLAEERVILMRSICVACQHLRRWSSSFVCYVISDLGSYAASPKGVRSRAIKDSFKSVINRKCGSKKGRCRRIDRVTKKSVPCK